jgi:hypothetical protein
MGGWFPLEPAPSRRARPPSAFRRTRQPAGPADRGMGRAAIKAPGKACLAMMRRQGTPTRVLRRAYAALRNSRARGKSTLFSR